MTGLLPRAIHQDPSGPDQALKAGPGEVRYAGRQEPVGLDLPAFVERFRCAGGAIGHGSAPGDVAVPLDDRVRDAASAFALIALKLRPGGSISPFCDPDSVTSSPHSSWRRSIEPSADTASTSSSAGCFARSIARRISGSRLVAPVEVSLWTTSSARRR